MDKKKLIEKLREAANRIESFKWTEGEMLAIVKEILIANKDTVAESPAGMAGSTARCDEADHVLINLGGVEHGMTAIEAMELAAKINRAAFLAAHKAGFEQGR
jgi:hypothetical protein